ncbi:MAG: hypothetical protein Q7J85_07125 [Bacillota bacterium]|nr:hypothetical protein [Bacillota bacterium]
MKEYTNEDYDYIKTSLKDEGLTDEKMTFETDNTFITDVGFFSYRIEGEYPRLMHFYVDKDKRGGGNFRRLARDFWGKLIEGEHLFCVIELPKGKQYLKRFIEYYGGKEPYYEENGNKYYLVPTIGRIRK